MMNQTMKIYLMNLDPNNQEIVNNNEESAINQDVVPDRDPPDPGHWEENDENILEPNIGSDDDFSILAVPNTTFFGL